MIKRGEVKKNAVLILTMAVEIVLLILILIVVLLGVVGIFLPILPGIFLIGIGVALYGLILKSSRSRAIRIIHPYVRTLGQKLRPIINNRFTMGIKKFLNKRKPAEHDREMILKYGLILSSFNLALTVALIFGIFVMYYIGPTLFYGSTARIPGLALIFVFGSISGVLWYRFGQILGDRFKQRHMVNGAITVLVSLIPILAMLMIFVNFFSVLAIFPLLAITSILAFFYIIVLAVCFELILVSLGVMMVA